MKDLKVTFWGRNKKPETVTVKRASGAPAVTFEKGNAVFMASDGGYYSIGFDRLLSIAGAESLEYIDGAGNVAFHSNFGQLYTAGLTLAIMAPPVWWDGEPSIRCRETGFYIGAEYITGVYAWII